jgi:hypothetical protein
VFSKNNQENNQENNQADYFYQTGPYIIRVTSAFYNTTVSIIRTTSGSASSVSYAAILRFRPRFPLLLITSFITRATSSSG